MRAMAIVTEMYAGPRCICRTYVCPGDGARNNDHHHPKDWEQRLQGGVVFQGVGKVQHVGQGEEGHGP